MKLLPSVNEWIAYVAGFFDGEGCVIINKTPAQYSMHCTVGNTHRKTLDDLQRMWGGAIKKHNGFKVKEGWQWDVAALKAKQFLIDILPYLVIKRDEALLALEFQAEINAKRTSRLLMPEDLALREGYKLALSTMKH